MCISQRFDLDLVIHPDILYLSRAPFLCKRYGAAISAAGASSVPIGVFLYWGSGWDSEHVKSVFGQRRKWQNTVECPEQLLHRKTSLWGEETEIEWFQWIPEFE